MRFLESCSSGISNRGSWYLIENFLKVFLGLMNFPLIIPLETECIQHIGSIKICISVSALITIYYSIYLHSSRFNFRLRMCVVIKFRAKLKTAQLAIFSYVAT